MLFSDGRVREKILLRRLRRRQVDSNPLYRDAFATSASGPASNPYAAGLEAA
jgi:hypothetical protein